MNPTVTEPTASHSAAPSLSERSFTATRAMLALALAVAVMLLYAGRDLTFFFDEWNFILGSRGESVGTYLDPHNGHLVLFAIVIYKLLFAVVGMHHYWPYRAVVVVLHILCVWILYVLARRRVGPLVALVPATLLLLLGSAYEDLLWPFQITFLGPVAGGLGALALLDRGGSRADPGACALLVWSLTGSGVGVAFLIAAAAMLLAQRAAPRRFWLVALPALLYVIWYLGWGTSEQPTVQAALGAPQYIADAASAATAGIAGLSAAYGPPLAVAALSAVVLALLARRAAPAPLLIAGAVGALAFWGLSAVARADAADPGSSRYLYVGAVFLLLIATDAATGVALRRSGLALLGLLLVGALVANVNLLRSGERSLRSTDDTVRASLGAVEVASPVVAPSFVADPQGAPQVQAGPFLAAIRELGSPALTLAQLEQAPPSVRYEVDPVLEGAERLAPTPVAAVVGHRALGIDSFSTGRLVARGRCDEFYPAGSEDVFDLRLPAGTNLGIKPQPGTDVLVYLRRFAPAFTPPPFATIAGRAAIRFPDDLASALPWHVRLTSAAPFTACSV